jgi:hypothetical protein
MTTISADQLVHTDGNVTIINAGDHQGSREIRGAVRYRAGDLLEPDHLALPIDHDETVILYAEHGPTDKLRRIADKMLADGFNDVRVFEGSLKDYEALGGETQESSLEQVVPPMRPDEVQKLDRRL